MVASRGRRTLVAVVVSVCVVTVAGAGDAASSKTWIWHAPFTGSGDEPQIVFTRKGAGPIFVTRASARAACSGQPVQTYTGELESGIPVTSDGSFAYKGVIGGDVAGMSLTLDGRVSGNEVTGTYRVVIQFGDPSAGVASCVARSPVYRFAARCTVGCDTWVRPVAVPVAKVCSLVTPPEVRRVLGLPARTNVRISGAVAKVGGVWIETGCALEARQPDGLRLLSLAFSVKPDRARSHLSSTYQTELDISRREPGVTFVRPSGLGPKAFGAYDRSARVYVLHRERLLTFGWLQSGTDAQVRDRFAKLVRLARVAYPRFKRLV